jgi:hypothetical protein
VCAYRDGCLFLAWNLSGSFLLCQRGVARGVDWGEQEVYVRNIRVTKLQGLEHGSGHKYRGGSQREPPLFRSGRGDTIRTCDLLNPIQVCYRAALRPAEGRAYYIESRRGIQTRAAYLVTSQAAPARLAPCSHIITGVATNHRTRLLLRNRFSTINSTVGRTRMTPSAARSLATGMSDVVR